MFCKVWCYSSCRSASRRCIGHVEFRRRVWKFSTRALSVELVHRPFWMTSSRVLTNCFRWHSVNINDKWSTTKIWAIIWPLVQMAATSEKIVEQQGRCDARHCGQEWWLDSLNDPMTRHDISSKLRSVGMSLNLSTSTCKKYGRRARSRVLGKPWQIYARVGGCFIG
jgi:hypothetical protein